MDEEGKIEKFKKQDEFWVGIIEKYEERNAELEQEQRALQSRVDQMEASMPAVMAYNMVKLANEKPGTDVDKLITAPSNNVKDSTPRKPMKLPDLNNMSVFSIQDEDLRYMDRIKQLTEQEKKLIDEVNQLRGKEKVLRDNKKKVDNIMGVPQGGGMKALVDGTDLQKMNEKLLDENRRLCDEIADLKLELKHNREMVEGPMSRELDRERRKGIKLEGELKEREMQEKQNNSGARKEIAFLKEQLRSGEKNLKDMSDINDKLKDEVSILSKRIAELQNDLINQKLSEANSLAILKAQLEKSRKDPPPSGGAPPGPGPKPDPPPNGGYKPDNSRPPDGPNGGDNSSPPDVTNTLPEDPPQEVQPKTEDEEPERESPAPDDEPNNENELYKMARDLSKELKSVPQSAKVPEDLKGTVAGIKNICDVLGKPKSPKTAKGCICGEPDQQNKAGKVAIREDEVPVKEPREGSTEEVQTVTDLQQPEVVVFQNDGGANITTTVTHDGYLKVTTQGPAGEIETIMALTESGRVEVVTEYSEAEPQYRYHPEGSQDAAFFRKASDLDDPGGTSALQDKKGDSDTVSFRRNSEILHFVMHELNNGAELGVSENFEEVELAVTENYAEDTSSADETEHIEVVILVDQKSFNEKPNFKFLDIEGHMLAGDAVMIADEEDRTVYETTIQIPLTHEGSDAVLNWEDMECRVDLVGSNNDCGSIEEVVNQVTQMAKNKIIAQGAKSRDAMQILRVVPGLATTVTDDDKRVINISYNEGTFEATLEDEDIGTGTGCSSAISHSNSFLNKVKSFKVVKKRRQRREKRRMSGYKRRSYQKKELQVIHYRFSLKKVEVKLLEKAHKATVQFLQRRAIVVEAHTKKAVVECCDATHVAVVQVIGVLRRLNPKETKVQFLQRRANKIEVHTKKAVLECLGAIHIAVVQVFRNDVLKTLYPNEHSIPKDPLNEVQLYVYSYNNEDLEGGMSQRMSFVEKGDTEVNEKGQSTDLCRRPTAPCELPTIHSESEIRRRRGKLDDFRPGLPEVQYEQENVSNDISEELQLKANVSAKVFNSGKAEKQLPITTTSEIQTGNANQEAASDPHSGAAEGIPRGNDAGFYKDLIKAMINENRNNQASLHKEASAPPTSKHLVNMEALSSIQAILRQEMRLLEDHNHQFMEMQKAFNECVCSEAKAEFGCFIRQVVHIATAKVLPVNTFGWSLPRANSEANVQEEISMLSQKIHGGLQLIREAFSQRVVEEQLLPLEVPENIIQAGLRKIFVNEVVHNDEKEVALQEVEKENRMIVVKATQEKAANEIAHNEVALQEVEMEIALDATNEDVIKAKIDASQPNVEVVDSSVIFRDENAMKMREDVHMIKDNLYYAAPFQNLSEVKVEEEQAVSFDILQLEEECDANHDVPDVIENIIENVVDIATIDENPVEYATQGTQTSAPRLEKIIEARESEIENEDDEEMAGESTLVAGSILEEIIEKVCAISKKAGMGDLKHEPCQETNYAVQNKKSSAMVTKIISIVRKLEDEAALGKLHGEENLRDLVEEALVGLIDFDRQQCGAIEEEEWHDAEEGDNGDEECVDSIEEILEGMRSSGNLVSQSELDILQPPKLQSDNKQFLRVPPKILRNISVPSVFEISQVNEQVSDPSKTSLVVSAKNTVLIKSTSTMTQSELDILHPIIDEDYTSKFTAKRLMSKLPLIPPEVLVKNAVPLLSTSTMTQSEVAIGVAAKSRTSDPSLTNREVLAKSGVEIKSTSTMTQPDNAILHPPIAEVYPSRVHSSTCDCIDCIVESLEEKGSSDSSVTCRCQGPCVCCARKSRSDRTLKQNVCYCTATETEVKGLVSAGDRTVHSEDYSKPRKSIPTEAGEGSKLDKSSEELLKLLDEGHMSRSTVCLFKTPVLQPTTVYYHHVDPINGNGTECSCAEDDQQCESLDDVESEYSCDQATNEKKIQTLTCACPEPQLGHDDFKEDQDFARTLAGKTPDISETDCSCSDCPSTCCVAKKVTEIQGLIDKIACACKEAETMSPPPVFRGEQICNEETIMYDIDIDEEDLLPEPQEPINIFRPSPTMLPRFGQLPAPCACTQEMQAANCECTVDSKPLKIKCVKQVGPKSVLVKWVACASNRILGYEICVNDTTMSRVYNRLRTSAVLDCLIPSTVNKICIYGVDYNGRCFPPARAEFKIC